MIGIDPAVHGCGRGVNAAFTRPVAQSLARRLQRGNGAHR